MAEMGLELSFNSKSKVPSILCSLNAVLTRSTSSLFIIFNLSPTATFPLSRYSRLLITEKIADHSTSPLQRRNYPFPLSCHFQKQYILHHLKTKKQNWGGRRTLPTEILPPEHNQC